MLIRLHPVQKLLLIVAAMLALLGGPNIAAGQSVPILVQAEAMTLVAPMASGYDIAAMGGRFISVPTGVAPATPTVGATFDVKGLPSGTYYLWARIAGPTTTNDALYVGIDNLSFERVFPDNPGSYFWVQVPNHGGASFEFNLGGDHTIKAGYGEIGAKLDALYLTNSATDVPSLSAPARLLIQGEAMNLAANSQMTVVNDAIALGGKYLSTSAPSTTTPPPRATVQVHLPAGTYYLWARVGGASIASDAMYVGIDSLARTFPDPTAPLAWARVRINQPSSDVAFVFTQPGVRTIQVGEGETNARLDAVYLTTDATEVPSFAPLRRLIEAESLTPEAVEPPMTVGTDPDASGGQYRAATTGTSPATPIRAAAATFDVSTEGTYYLWARVKGLTATSDASYAGFDNAWARVFPSVTGAYEWVRVQNREDSGAYETVLQPGQHSVQIGVGEIGARVDALYITDSDTDGPTGATTPPGGGGTATAPDCALPTGQYAYQGFGRTTRGGLHDDGTPIQIVEVTNLNDRGDHSLRAAVSQGNRCVVFKISGTIKLESSLVIGGPNITIDGLSAPSPGITLEGRDETVRATLTIGSQTGNVILRGIRHRFSPGDCEGRGDAISVNGASRVVIDRVSVSGFGDGGIDVRNARDVSIQWSIIGKGLCPKPNASLMTADAARVSAHHNLYSDANDRQPFCGGPATVAPVCDVRYNLIWNYTQAGTAVRQSGTANVISNYYSTSRSITNPEQTIWVDGGTAHVSGNHSQNNFNINDNGNRSTAFPVDTADIPSLSDARTAARAIIDLDPQRGAGARGNNVPLDDFDRNLLGSIMIP